MKPLKIFHSMYFKWVMAFVALLLIAQAMTVAFSFRAIISETSEILADKLERKAAIVMRFYQEGHPVAEDIMLELGDTDIELAFLSNYANHPLESNFTTDMIKRALAGEIVLAHSAETFHRMPFGLFALSGQLVLISPILPQNELTIFVNGIARAMALNIILSSVFVSAALMFIILKIRRITAATREVARGNFNIELFTRSQDEVGELMRNFNAMTKELRQSVYLKKDFVSSISHEFKTPITAIEGFAKLLQGENLTPEQFKEYTDIIIKETARLGGLSTNLLRLTLLDNSDFKPESAPFYLDEQIRGTILLLERTWEEKGINFDINMEEILFNGNEELLSQVWINLLQNAIKFSPTRGTIEVKLAAKGNFVLAEISDQGSGIPEELKDKVFTRFFKASKQDTEGNGLGLPIAKRIVELCGGQIWFENASGRINFFVNLPMKQNS